jgi:hypothetical protein
MCEQRARGRPIALHALALQGGYVICFFSRSDDTHVHFAQPARVQVPSVILHGTVKDMQEVTADVY